MAGLKDLLYGTGGLTSQSMPSDSDNASARIEANPHPQGVWQILAQFARMRGMAKLEKIAQLKEEQERLDKQDERRLRMDEIENNIRRTGLDDKYKQSMIDQISHNANLADRDQAIQEDTSMAKSTQDAFAADEGYDETRTNPERGDGGVQFDLNNLKYKQAPNNGATEGSIPDTYRDKRTVSFGNGQTREMIPESRQAKSARELEMLRAKAGIEVGKQSAINASKPGTRKGLQKTTYTNGDSGWFDPNGDPDTGQGVYYWSDGTVNENPRISQPLVTVPGKDATTGAPNNTFSPRSAVEGKTVEAPIPSDERVRIANFGPVNLMLDQIEELSNQINTEYGIASRVGGAWRRAKAWAGYDTPVTALQSKLGLLATFAKQMGDVGNIAVAEAERISKALPLDPMASAAEAQKLIADFRAIVKEQEAARRGAAGLNGGPRGVTAPVGGGGASGGLTPEQRARRIQQINGGR